MATPNQNMTGSQDTRRTILYVIIGLLLAGNAVLIYMNFNKNKENKALTVQAEEISADLKATEIKLDSISQVLDTKIADLEQKGKDITELTALKDQLEKDKAALVADGKAKTFSLQKYQDRITQYEAMLNKKDEEIKRLKDTNVELLTETTQLKEKQNKLSDSISGINQEKSKLQEQVNMAAALKAESITVHSISGKGKERDSKDSEFKAKNVDKIKIDFRLAENKLTKIEGKTIYMRVIEPNGVALSESLAGGGSFTVDGRELSYTQKQDILFDNSHQGVAFVFKKSNGEYMTGKHTVEFYSEGFKIGQGTFTIK
jgi:uncharacterized protein (DUF3084 family)